MVAKQVQSCCRWFKPAAGWGSIRGNIWRMCSENSWSIALRNSMNFYLIDGFLPGPNLKKSAPDFLTVNMARLDGYEHAEVPMDNNTAERGLRGGAVGRKNYYGSSSIQSAEFTAIMFTIIQTLLIWNINPHAWF